MEGDSRTLLGGIGLGLKVTQFEPNNQGLKDGASLHEAERSISGA